MSLGKKDITINISTRAQIPKEISFKFLIKFLNLIANNSKTKKVKISNFGSFHKKETSERLGRNPKTGEEYLISKRSKIDFKSSYKIKKLLN